MVVTSADLSASHVKKPGNKFTAMRTSATRSAIILATALITFNSRAAGPGPLAHPGSEGPSPAPARELADMERELERQNDKYVTYPLLERTHRMDGKVIVSFVIDTEGRVKVLQAHSRNTALCECVLRMLDKVDIGSNPEGLWRTTYMRFDFRPEV